MPTDLERLVTEWGMTRDGAESAASGRQSFACVLLRHENSVVGALYLDAVPRHAFPEDICSRLAASDDLAILARAVGELHGEAAKLGPGLQLRGDA